MPMGFMPNIVIKKLKEIHFFVSQIIAVPRREERIHNGCLPFAWLYNKFLSSLLKTAASFSQPLFPVINSVFGRRCRKVMSLGREDTRVWYRETMFSQMVSYDFLLHGLLH